VATYIINIYRFIFCIFITNRLLYLLDPRISACRGTRHLRRPKQGRKKEEAEEAWLSGVRGCDKLFFKMFL